MVGVPSSCALLRGFAIGALWFRCYDNIALNAKFQRVLVLALCVVIRIYRPIGFALDNAGVKEV